MSDENLGFKTQTPRWVKLLGIVAVVLVLALGLLHFKHLRYLVGFGH